MSVNQGFHALEAQESEILIWVRASGNQLLTRNNRPHVRGQKCSELMKSPHTGVLIPATHLFCPYHNNVILQKFLEEFLDWPKISICFVENIEKIKLFSFYHCASLKVHFPIYVCGCAFCKGNPISQICRTSAGFFSHWKSGKK